MKIKYNALFFKAEEGGFIVTFPDIPSVITQGDTFDEAKEMAFDVIGLALLDENGKFTYPMPTNKSDIYVPEGAVLVSVLFDETEYLNKHIG